MNKDTLQGQLDQFVGAAKTQWGKLRDDDFLRIEGDAQKLKGLIQERYGITIEDAEKQVHAWEAGRKHKNGHKH